MMIRKKRMWAAMGAAVAVALTVAGCSGGSGTSSAGGPTLAIYNGASGAFTKNFNPFSPTVLSDVTGLIYEPLFFFNGLASLGEKAKPVLGKSYSWNDDGTELSVVTQSGIQWADGKPFTAKDVAFTMNLIHDTPAINTTGNAPTAKASDDTHVTLTFAKPSFTSGPNILGLTYIVPQHIWTSKKDPAKDVNDNPIGTGPMKVSSFTSQSYLLQKNAKYRDASKVQVGGIRLYSLSGNEAATNKLLANQLDWAGIFIPDVKKVLGSKPTIKYTVYGSQQVVLDTCANTALGCSGPQTDAVVRQAMSAALNREQVNKLAYYDLADPINPTFALSGRDDQFIAKDYAEPLSMSPDVSAAKKLLEGDGWTAGSDGIYQKGGQRLSMKVLVTSGYTDYIAALQAIQQQFKAAGIEIDVQQVANQEKISSTGLGKFQLAIDGIFQGPVADPFYVYDKYFNSAGTAKVGEQANPYGNYVRYSNSTVDQQVAVAAGTEDSAAKAKAYAIIQEQIVKDLPYIPIINNHSFVEYSTKQVTGFPTADDLYAIPAPGAAPDNAQVLLKLTKK